MPPASKEIVIEAFVLSTRRFLGNILPAGPLRDTIQHEWDDLCQDGSFNLERFWLYFEQQEGLDPRAAAAPLCFFKALEPRLGLRVLLPEPLAALSQEERDKLAGLCGIKPHELNHVFTGGSASTSLPTMAPPRPSGGTPVPEEIAVEAVQEVPLPEATPPRSRRTILAVGSVAALAIAGFFITSTIRAYMDRTGTSEPIDPASFTQTIPLTDAKAFGREVIATLASPAWLGQPEDDRRRQVEAALVELRKSQIVGLTIYDGNRKLVASASWLKQPVVPAVMFPKP